MATFNSGLKMPDANGGSFVAGRRGNTAAGAAAVVIYASGTATVGQWGASSPCGPMYELTLRPYVVADRCNAVTHTTSPVHPGVTTRSPESSPDGARRPLVPLPVPTD
jgi:hypothetical protein